MKAWIVLVKFMLEYLIQNRLGCLRFVDSIERPTKYEEWEKENYPQEPEDLEERTNCNIERNSRVR